MRNTPNLVASFALSTVPVTCPPGHPNCTQISFPTLYNTFTKPADDSRTYGSVGLRLAF